MGQSTLAVHADVQLHAKVPLLAFARLVHLRVARIAIIHGGTGRTNDGGVHDGACVDLEAASLQFLADLGKLCFAQFVIVEELA
jgi:hypothetical protein